MPTVKPASSRAPATRTSLGFTLVELIVAMVLIAIAMLGITYSLSYGLRYQSHGLSQAQSVALAQAYLDEMLGQKFDANTPVGGMPPCHPDTLSCAAADTFGASGPRAAFTSINDYDGLDESPPLDIDGNPRSGYNGYRVRVAVRYASAAEQSEFALDASEDAKVMQVRVSDPSGSELVLAAYRGNF